MKSLAVMLVTAVILCITGQDLAAQNLHVDNEEGIHSVLTTDVETEKVISADEISESYLKTLMKNIPEAVRILDCMPQCEPERVVTSSLMEHIKLMDSNFGLTAGAKSDLPVHTGPGINQDG